MTGEIFISYRRADQDKARLLHALLKHRGIDAWYDGLLGPGDDWRHKTAHALEAAPIFVLLFSKTASESDDISKELAAATFSRKLVIPVRIENIRPTGAFLYELASRNWIDAYEDTEAKLADLADKLVDIVKGGASAEVAAYTLGAPGPAPKIVSATKPWFKRPAILAGAAAVAVALAAGAFFMTRGPASQTAAGASPSGGLRVAFFGYTANDDPAAKQAAAIATEEGYRSFSALRLDAVNRADIEQGGDGSTIDRAHALGARFVLEGSMRSEGDKLRVTSALVDVPSRTTIVQNSTMSKIADPRYAGTSSATTAAGWANCVVSYVSGFGGPTDPSTLTLFGDVCTRPPAVQDAPLRDLLKRNPDSGLANGRLAYALAFTLLGVPAAQRPAVVAEADAALARAEALAPNAYSTSEARISVGIAHDRPPADWLPRAEADLARPPSRDEAFFYAAAKSSVGQMLLQVGRTADASLYLQAAYDTDPSTGMIRYYMPLMRAAAGQYGAKEGFETALSRRVNGYFWEITMVSAIFMDTMDPEAVFSRATEDVETFAPCYRDLIASLKAKDVKTRLAGAKRADACLTKFDSPHVNIMAQAVLGDLDRAFAIADRPDLTQLFWNVFPTLFLPPNRPMRADPRFLPLMAKLGYVDYWKQTKTKPDVCATPEERDIPLCKALQ